tara:strand:+ start:55 stop:555 length:501 start_codon:yes stop_codon:yes gene_type:complete
MSQINVNEWVPATGTTSTITAATVTFAATTVNANATTINASGTLALADNIVSAPKFKDYSEVVNAIGSTGGGTQDFDLTLGNTATATVDTSANTFTFSNPPATGTAGTLTLILTNGGSQTVNWPGAVDWPGGSAPTLTTSGIDILTFITIDAGTIWYGFGSGIGMA